MVVFPNAKINLGLDVLNKRPDGFHDISSCFVPIDWYDILEVLPSNQFSFTSSGIDIPGNQEENLCALAWQLIKRDHNIGEVKIHLHKNIPIGAGLGGGSADGAFMLKALNTLFELNLSINTLQEYAAELGSDCPFFIENKPILASGTGTSFSSVTLKLESTNIVLVYPNKHISTKEAYSNIKPAIPSQSVSEILSLDIKNWKGLLKNDFERSLFPNHKILGELKNKFYNKGAFYASMTGSGSTVYGLFSQEPNVSFNNPDYIIHQGKLIF